MFLWVFENEDKPTKVIRTKSAKERVLADFYRRTESGSGMRSILFYYDNARPYTVAKTLGFSHVSWIQLISHLPYMAKGFLTQMRRLKYF